MIDNKSPQVSHDEALTQMHEAVIRAEQQRDAAVQRADEAEAQRLRVERAAIRDLQREYLERVPEGTRLCYFDEKRGTVVVLGEPAGDDHDCDAMGCGREHVIARHRVVVHCEKSSDQKVVLPPGYRLVRGPYPLQRLPEAAHRNNPIERWALCRHDILRRDCATCAAPIASSLSEAVLRYVELATNGYPFSPWHPEKRNAPTHGHSRPGIWDDGNGDGRGGKPCELCRAWNDMRALAADAHDWWSMHLLVFAAIDHIQTLDKLVTSRDEILDALLCPTHGRCVPHALDQIARMKAELQAQDRLRERLTSLLDGVAVALKGRPGELEMHGWHDLPERAQTMTRFIDAWSSWVLNSYVCSDPQTRETARSLRAFLRLNEVTPSESWDVERLHAAMVDARAALDDGEKEAT